MKILSADLKRNDTLEQKPPFEHVADYLDNYCEAEWNANETFRNM